MSLKLANRIQQTTTTTGTADFQLIAPDANRSPFDDVGSGQEVPYYAENATGTEWEYGRGTITSGSPDQLARTTVLKSSSSNNKVNFSAGTKTIYLALAAEMTIWVGSSDAHGFTDIASAATTNIGSVNTMGANVTGTTTITSFGSHANTFRFVKFAASLTLTHNATSLILIDGKSRITATGAVGLYISDASGNWREISYSGDEVGTFTPQLQFGGAAVGMSISAFGYYRKRGNVVSYHLEFTLANKGSSTGTATLSGLPYTSANVSGGRCAASIVCDATSGLTQAVAYVGPSSSSIALQNFASNALASMTNANFTNTSNFMIAGSYEI